MKENNLFTKQDLVVGLQKDPLTVRIKVIKCGTKQLQFICKITGFKRAAVMQERNTSIAIQRHQFNTWQQLNESIES